MPIGPDRLPPHPSFYGKWMMELLSRPTGGRVFEVREKQSKQPASFPRFPLPPRSPLPPPFPMPRRSADRGIPIERIFAAIEEDLRNQYSLGYTSDAGTAPGYRRIQVRTVQKDLTVRARDGYYAS